MTTKLRIVYDASATTCGPSLNDCLHAGPKFGQNIMDILLRFRTHRTALAADIEKAFLIYPLHPMKGMFFVSFRLMNINKKLPKIVALRFTCVVFGVSSSPILLNATINHRVERYRDVHPQFVKIFMINTC